MRQWHQWASRQRLTLIAALVLAAGLRIVNLTRESAWLDEIFSIQFVSTRDFLRVIGDSFRIDFHPFSYYVLLDGWVSAFGCSDFAARLLSVFLGIGAILSAYFLAKTAFHNVYAALLCAFLAAISPIHILYSQEARMYVLLLLVWPLFLASLRACWRTRYCGRNCIWLLVTFAIFAYAHGTAGLFALPVVVVCTGLFVAKSILSGHKSDALRAIVVAISAVVVYSPWLVRLLVLEGDEKQLGAFGICDVLLFFQWMIFGRSPFSTRQLLAGALAVMAVLLAMFRCGQLLRRVVRPILPLIASIGAVLVLQFLLSLFKPCYQQRNIVFLLPPSLACISFFIVQVLRLSQDSSATRLPRRLALAFVLIPCVGFCLFVANGTVRQIESGVGKEEWRESVREIGPSINRGDLLAFYASFMQQCWDHYAVGYDCSPAGPSEIPEYQTLGIPRTRDEHAFMAAVQEVINGADQMDAEQNSLWVFYSHVGDAARVDSLLQSARLREIGEWSGRGIVVKRYEKGAETEREPRQPDVPRGTQMDAQQTPPADK